MTTPRPREKRCRRLRSKGMFIDVEPDPLVPNTSDGFFWCSETLTCLGPDGKPVDEESCHSRRTCHQSF
ncbi:MAG: hypothetical protein ACE5JX_08750 [Acidobacteriota bacterium]